MKNTMKGTYGMYSGAVLVTPEGHKIGTLCVLDTKPKNLSEKQLSLLLGLSKQVVSLIELRKRTRELGIAMLDLHKIASEDVLTGLATRRALLDRLRVEVERSRRFPTHLTVVMLDLDHFKKINDSFDHAMGDAVLRNIGALIRSRVRNVDIAGRYGGEEFCLVLPGTDLNGGLTFAESLRAAIGEVLIEDAGRQVKVTASLGVSSAASGLAIAGEELIRAADTALYNAKNKGRNQVVAAT
jgi:diguanylate cyclase (GGDEF)-like protein